MYEKVYELVWIKLDESNARWNSEKKKYLVLVRVYQHEEHTLLKSVVFLVLNICKANSGQALRFPGDWGSQISRHSAHIGEKFVNRTHRPLLHPAIIPGTHFYYRLSDPRAIMQPEGLWQLKIPMTPSVIEPATFWFIARALFYVHIGIIKAYCCVAE